MRNVKALTVDLNAPGYYVSAMLGERYALVAGPFASHAEALVAVEPARAAAVDEGAWGGGREWFAAWGTCRVLADSEPVPIRVRRVRLPLFDAPPSEGRFRVYASSSGHLRCRFAGQETPGVGWVEVARVNMPRRAVDFDGMHAACAALVAAGGF